MKYFKIVFLVATLARFLWDPSDTSLLICVGIAAIFYVLIAAQEADESKEQESLKQQVSVLRLEIENLHAGSRKISKEFDDESIRVAKDLSKLEAALKEQAKAIEESKKFVSQANLGMGFRAVKREA